jgi:two-component system, sensor histidine kinase PdtaS
MATRPKLLQEDPGLSLALAMVVSSTAPLLLLDDGFEIIASSASFCRTFGVDPVTVVGRQLFALGDGEWNVPQLRSLMAATVSGDAEIEAYEMDLARAGGPRRLVINVQRLAYGDPDHVRLLVAVADVTEARLIEKRSQDLLRQNEVLIQEVRHRVANSLQIIASVLLQNARRSQSEETKLHLRDAHQRVMSVAQLQQQLAASTMGTAELSAYLTKLCESIAASMIVDPKRLVLKVVAAEATIDAGVSVSLGLIVTELVINALKHAFPADGRGEIVIDYVVAGPGWTLSVRDNGKGMPKAHEPAVGGLGSSIVEALAKQLKARVVLEDMAPGTKVSIVHAGAASDPAKSTVLVAANS